MIWGCATDTIKGLHWPPGAGAARKKIPGAGAAWEKNQEPEPLEKKVRSRSR